MQTSVITVKGNVGSIEPKFTPSGEFICEFSIAVNHKRKGEEFVNWFKGEVWGKQGELFNNLVQKGTLIEVEGEFMIESWTSKDGAKGTTNHIAKVYRFDVCAKGKSKEDSDNPYDGAEGDLPDVQD